MTHGGGQTPVNSDKYVCYERQIPQSHGILYVNLRNDNFHRLPQLRGLPTATAVALEEAAMR